MDSRGRELFERFKAEAEKREPSSIDSWEEQTAAGQILFEYVGILEARLEALEHQIRGVNPGLPPMSEICFTCLANRRAPVMPCDCVG